MKEVIRTNMKTFTALIHQEGKSYVADCPEVGTVSQGNTIEEALANLREATELYIESGGIPYIQDYGKAFITTFEAAVNV